MTAMERMTKARAQLILYQPFYGVLSLQLELIEAPDKTDSMATDGRRLFFNAAYVETLSDPELMFVIAHEVSHCAYRHHTRRGARDLHQWNVAADYAINGDLVKAAFVAPQGILLDAKYDGLGAEAIYRMIADAAAQEQEPEDDQGDGDGDDAQQPDEGGDGDEDGDDTSDQSESGEGDEPSSADADGDGDGDGDDQSGGTGDGQSSGQAGGTEQPAKNYGGCGAVLDASEESPAEVAAQDAKWEAYTRQAINVAVKQCGSVPGFLERLVENLKAPRVDWREVLRRFIDGRARMDHSWSSPARRLLWAGHTLPGAVPDGINHLGVAVDTSGSISDVILAAFASELQAAMDEGACDQITVVYCDSTVQGSERFETGETVKLTPLGGGGTRFSPALEWLGANEPDLSAIIYFTDLECWDFGNEPECPVLWAAYGDPRDVARRTVPFGEVVQIVV